MQGVSMHVCSPCSTFDGLLSFHRWVISTGSTWISHGQAYVSPEASKLDGPLTWDSRKCGRSPPDICYVCSSSSSVGSNQLSAAGDDAVAWRGLAHAVGMSEWPLFEHNLFIFLHNFIRIVYAFKFELTDVNSGDRCYVISRWTLDSYKDGWYEILRNMFFVDPNPENVYVNIWMHII